jgi:(p)ppGpp synthase/HD superfamily hydrolase
MAEHAAAPLLSPKFALALQFANEIHARQKRKGLGAPYMSHLMAVCAFVLEYGGNETQAIAALLHDAAEDCGGYPMLGAVRAVFGEDVADIVAACSDTFEIPKPEWWQRKREYIARLASEPGSMKLVSCADKLHNLTHTLRDIRTEGVAAWKERMAQTKNGTAEKQTFYYLGCCESLGQNWSGPILGEFARAVVSLCELVGTPDDVAKAKALLAPESKPE